MLRALFKAICGLLMLFSAGCFPNTRLLGPDALGPIDKRIQQRYIPGATSAPSTPDIDRYYSSNDDSERVALRNHIITGLMAVDDFNFQKYASQTSFAQRAAATSSDWIILGLTSAATITGGEQAKTVLAGVAAAITGGRIALDKEVFYDTTLPVLLQRMQKMRERKRVEIVQKLQTLTDKEYTLEAGVSDVYDYFRSGTLSAAVADIAEETARMNPQAPADIVGIAEAINKAQLKFTAEGSKADGSKVQVSYTITSAQWESNEHKVLMIKVKRDGAADVTVAPPELSAKAKAAIGLVPTTTTTSAFLSTQAQRDAFNKLTINVSE